MAVIDIGSNSTRLLIADVAGRARDAGRAAQHGDPARARRRPQRPARRRGDRGRLRAVDPYVATLRELGAEEVDAIATSAVRDAANGSAFVAELRERFALSARVLDGEEEARLTYLGATSETSPERPDPGDRHRRRLDRADRRRGARRSSGTPRCRPASSATPSATSSPTRRPPVELEALADDLRGLIEAATVERLTRRSAGIAVAGTPTSLAAMELELEPYDPRAGPRPRARAAVGIQRMLSLLASAPLAERTEIPGLHADRAPTIVAGVVILVEAMRAFGLERDHSLRARHPVRSGDCVIGFELSTDLPRRGACQVPVGHWPYRPAGQTGHR